MEEVTAVNKEEDATTTGGEEATKGVGKTDTDVTSAKALFDAVESNSTEALEVRLLKEP